MSRGEILTAVTIWLTILASAVAAAIFALSQNGHKWDSWARLIWTIAGTSLLAHVASAFHFYHQWSHHAAYRETARQTYEVFGVNWGGGIYVNYAFLVLWIFDVGWWWVGGLLAYRRRPWLLTVVWHLFVIFMFFNATVVFGTGFVRWLGLCVCFGLCVLWWIAWLKRNGDYRAVAKVRPNQINSQ